MSMLANCLPKKHFRSVRLILGDQLNASHSWFKQCDDDVIYLIAELKQETDYVRHHIQKVCAFFKAMDSFATALKSAGHHVCYLTLDETQPFNSLTDLISELLVLVKATEFGYQLPDEYRVRRQLADFCQESAIATQVYESEHFYLNDAELSRYFKPEKRHRMEHFYRKLRVQFNILMDGDSPQGGQWNFDANNRQKLTSSDLVNVPQPLIFANDVSEILARIKRHGVKTIGTPHEQLLWPVNRQQALALLAFFCDNCLHYFGRFQDAMTDALGKDINDGGWSLYHSRLSFALNSKMISPQLVVQRALTAYENAKGAIDIAQIEGFVRQILGWREFIRGIYWANMPLYKSLNFLEAKNDLPDWFWDGNTKMNCQHHAISQSLETSYAHHIQRLMVTGNFCLIAGIDPDQVDKWYLGIYIDALDWVELPNTRGMSQFADGGIVASKAYAASGNYINKMSDHCKNCAYQVKQTVSDNACPLNSLYWSFMVKHEQQFLHNPRNKMIYANWHKKPPADKQAILAKAASYLTQLNTL